MIVHLSALDVRLKNVETHITCFFFNEIKDGVESARVYVYTQKITTAHDPKLPPKIFVIF